MKKFIAALVAIIIATSTAVNAAESRDQNFVDNLISPITTKEKELNSQAEAQRKAREARQAQYEKQQKERQKALKKQQKERQKALKKKQKEAQKRRENTKNAIEAETNFWKSLFDSD